VWLQLLHVAPDVKVPHRWHVHDILLRFGTLLPWWFDNLVAPS
jgi:hypothetical protein